MSQHRSLKGSSTVGAKRNVLKRFERVKLLKTMGKNSTFRQLQLHNEMISFLYLYEENKSIYYVSLNKRYLSITIL